MDVYFLFTGDNNAKHTNGELQDKENVKSGLTSMKPGDGWMLEEEVTEIYTAKHICPLLVPGTKGKIEAIKHKIIHVHQ